MRRLIRAGMAGSAAAAAAAYLFVIRPWHLRWGATDAEIQGPQPGDDLVKNPRLQTTGRLLSGLRLLTCGRSWCRWARGEAASTATTGSKT